jgi:hypothetical protein
LKSAVVRKRHWYWKRVNRIALDDTQTNLKDIQDTAIIAINQMAQANFAGLEKTEICHENI